MPICTYVNIFLPFFPNILINSALLKFIIDINHSEKQKYLTSNNGLEFIGEKNLFVCWPVNVPSFSAVFLFFFNHFLEK